MIVGLTRCFWSIRHKYLGFWNYYRRFRTREIHAIYISSRNRAKSILCSTKSFPRIKCNTHSGSSYSIFSNTSEKKKKSSLFASFSIPFRFSLLLQNVYSLIKLNWTLHSYLRLSIHIRDGIPMLTLYRSGVVPIFSSLCISAELH